VGATPGTRIAALNRSRSSRGSAVKMRSAIIPSTVVVSTLGTPASTVAVPSAFAPTLALQLVLLTKNGTARSYFSRENTSKYQPKRSSFTPPFVSTLRLRDRGQPTNSISSMMARSELMFPPEYALRRVPRTTFQRSLAYAKQKAAPRLPWREP
jgi:hypothetical protein